jgi:hypothetical protein
MAMLAKAMECSRVPSVMIPYSQLLLVCGHPTLTGVVGLTQNLRRTCNHDKDAPKQSARSRLSGDASSFVRFDPLQPIGRV